MPAMTMQVAQRGHVTLPKELRDAYHLQPGDIMTVIDLGGVFVISKHQSEVAALADRLAASLMERGESLESMLVALRELRAADNDDDD